MAVYFLDTSALLKKYVRETGTEWVSAVMDSDENDCLIARVTLVEAVAAVARRAKAGHLSRRQAESILNKVMVELPSRVIVIEITAGVADQAMLMARTHALRGYDAIQLAAAVETRQATGLTQMRFVSADAELNLAASRSGFIVADPNDYDDAEPNR